MKDSYQTEITYDDLTDLLRDAGILSPIVNPEEYEISNAYAHTNYYTPSKGKAARGVLQVYFTKKGDK